MKLPPLLAALVLVPFCVHVAHADVLIVRPDGGQGFPDIQSAVDASAHGDTILVQTGTYSGFEVVDRTVSIVADFNAEVLVQNTVAIRNLSPGRTVLLSGLEIRGLDRNVELGVSTQFQATTLALELSNNQGPVRVSQCMIRGGNADILGPNVQGVPIEGSDGARVETCADVSFSNCILSGGSGGYTLDLFGVSGNSGAALSAQDSDVTLWDSMLTGGSSAAGYFMGGEGGHACENINGFLTMATSSLFGGRGGDGTDGVTGFEGSGGSAVFTSAGGTSYLSGVEATAGANGNGFSYPLPPVLLFSGPGSLTRDDSIERVLSAPRIAIQANPLELTYRGKTGDSFRLYYGYSTSTLFRSIYPLPLLVARPGRLTDDPLGTISTLSGETTALFDLPEIPPTSGSREIWMQGLVTSVDGRRHLTSPVSVTIINCSSLLPDCNGNSQFDSCDVALGVSEDCLNDGVPDECEPDCNFTGLPDACDIAAGTSLDCQGNGVPDECEPDCNGDGIPDDCEEDCNLNGIADPCDIANAQSTDQDGNEIPDECDGPIGNPLYVDDDAAPGGDGSIGAPFSDIRSAVLVASRGNSIVVADGLYVGPLNRGLSLQDDVDIVSENGPVNCIIDCEGFNRFLRVSPASEEGSQGRIRGLTVRNARPGSSFMEGGAIELRSCVDFRIENCSFEDCGSSTTGLLVRSGGAIYAEFCERIVIENCVFRTNDGFFGGAVATFRGSELSIEGCTFEDNQGDSGGAIHSWESGICVLDSTFRFNEARTGGAIELFYGDPAVETCLFEANSAQFSGGGVHASVGSPSNEAPPISHCLFLGNDATRDGGGLFFRNQGPETLQVDHCLFGGNTATTGAGLYLTGTALVTHCTLVDNSASSIGGGLLAVNGSNLELRNSILWNNASPIGPELYTFDAASFIARYCDIHDFPLTPLKGCGEPWCSTNVDVDPLFVDADGPDNNPATLLGNDWRLSANSPLIDAGSNTFSALDPLDLDRDGDRAEAISLDLNLRPRFIDLPNPDTGEGTGPLIDIGAFERQP